MRALYTKRMHACKAKYEEHNVADWWEKIRRIYSFVTDQLLCICLCNKTTLLSSINTICANSGQGYYTNCLFTFY